MTDRTYSKERQAKEDKHRQNEGFQDDLLVVKGSDDADCDSFEGGKDGKENKVGGCNHGLKSAIPKQTFGSAYDANASST